MDIITAINTAHTSIKLLKESLKFVLDSKIEQKAREKIDEVMSNFGSLQDTLFDIREELFQLQTQRDNFKKELEQRDNWDKKMSDYKLVKTPGGAIVHLYQGEPKYYICPKCIAKKEIQILQDQQNIYTGYFHCPSCNNFYTINVATKPPEPDPQAFY